MPPYSNEDRGRWFATGCIALFMLPFVGAGAFFMAEGFREVRHRSAGVWGILVGGLLAVFGVTFAAMAFIAVRKASARAQRARQFPSQPWLWRQDWIDRRVAESPGRTIGFLWVFAIVWCAISVPMAVGFFRLAAMRPFLLIPVVFLPLLGFVLVCSAAFSSLRAMKFGRSVCTIDRSPIAPGQTFHGEVAYRGSDVPESGYTMVLSCINRVVRGAGRNRTVSDDVLWSTEWRVAGALAMPSPVGMRVPFDAAIPPDGRSSDLRNSSDSILWRLDVAAELPGIDYKTGFELPVFETAAGHDDGAIAAYQISHRADIVHREMSGVGMRPLANGGYEYEVPPVRELKGALTPVIFLAIWWGIIAVILKFGAPLLFPIVFGAFGVLLTLFVLDMIFGESIVSADRSGVTARRQWFGAGKTTVISADQITAIAAKTGARSGSTSYFDVEARLRSGNGRAVARYLHSYEDADALAAKLWTAMGRQ